MDLDGRKIRELTVKNERDVVFHFEDGGTATLTGAEIWRLDQYDSRIGMFVCHDYSFVPKRHPCEIIWHFCKACGMDYLSGNWPREGCSCGHDQYETLGTKQGAIWRKIHFGDNFKYRCVRPLSNTTSW
jgi:hypothetical protein